MADHTAHERVPAVRVGDDGKSGGTQGRFDVPPDLDDGDDAILDRIWDEIGEKEKARGGKSPKGR